MEQRFPGRGLYNVSAAWRLPWDISPPALRRAVSHLSARHPAWRVTFGEWDGIPFQVVHDELPPDFREISVAESAGPDFEALLDRESSRPLDFQRGPLVRWVLFRAERQHPVLLLIVHHMVVDGWSISTLLPELGKLYRIERDGASTALPLPARGYEQFIQEQSDWRESAAGKRERAFWREVLSKNIPLLDLPTDHPARPEPSFDSGCILFPIPRPLQEKARKLASDTGVRPLAVWLAVWFTLLHRLGGQEALVTRIPIAGRGPTYDGILGFFVNTLPIRVYCAGAESFRTFLRHTADVLEAALVHRDWPFPLMTQDMDRNALPALLQNTFSWQNYNNFGEPGSLVVTKLGDAGDVWHVGGMDWELVRLPQQRDETLIQLQMINLPDNQYGALQYASDRLERATIRRWSGHFVRLLEGIVAEPDAKISQLPLLTDAERQQILIEWNRTQAPYPQDKCIHELFEEQVAKNPDAVALVFQDEEISYGELNARANRLAHWLRKLGVRSEVLVGLFVERSVAMIVSLLAILKAGGAYVPLDPNYPADRLAFMVEDAELAVLLCHGATRGRLPECSARILDLDAEASAIAFDHSANPARLAGPKNLAYVIYTSGSTGRPKGVSIEHRNTVALLYWGKSRYSPEELSGVLAATSVCFDLSVYEIFLPFSVGGMILLTEDVLSLGNIEARGRVTLVNTVPSAIQGLLDSDGIPDSVRIINLAGESLSQNTVDRLYALENIRKVYDLYGPSEDTTYSTCALRQQGGFPNIGRPISNTQVYILDSERQPTPIGIPGELYIGGAGVARGYLNRPDLTAERFIPDPFRGDSIGDDTDARLYRTGDLCRWLPDGNIEFLGRIDTQVKIRGFRIECGEVENALLSEPGVHEAVVDARGEGANKRLVAWMVAEGSYKMLQTGLRATLRTILRQHLPDWMAPSVFVFVDALPLTPSGKIDRKALPDPDIGELGADTEYVAPRDPVEEALCGIFAETLGFQASGLQRMGIHDGFFDLGGHSLLATKVISLIRARLGVELPLRALFEHPTPAALATAIGECKEYTPSLPVPLNVRAGQSKPPLFCIHPVGGGAFCYGELAACLDEDRPIYGIQAVGFEGNEAPLTELHAMAARYVAEIKTLWPSGPCNLYGWSFGGVVAFEMARLLATAGREVALLALADTAHPSWFEGREEPGDEEIMAHLLAEAGEGTAAFSHEAPDGISDEIKELAPEARRHLLRQRLSGIFHTEDSAGLDRFIAIYRNNLRALATCRLSPWAGDILFLAAAESPDADNQPLDILWRGLARRVDRRVVSGNHFTMHRQPNVAGIAEIVGGYLESRKT